MSKKYVGKRYVPKVMGEWNILTPYESLCIVTHDGASYTSKKDVPVGIDISNESYWVITGNYNAQVEGYRQEVDQLSHDVESKFLNLINPNKIDLSGYQSLGLDMVTVIKDKITQGYDYFIIPKGTIFNQVLDISNLFSGYNTRQIVFEGTTGVEDILLNTGGVGILINGSDNICFKNIGITNKNMNNPSNIAILQQRSVERDACQMCNFTRVLINMTHSPNVNNGYGSIGIYNCTAELGTYDNLTIYADNPFVATQSNIYNMATSTRSKSMKCIAFTGITTLISRKNSALILDGVGSFSFENLYTVTDAWQGEVLTEHAIIITGSSATGYENYNVNIETFDNEGFKSFMNVTGKIRGLTIKGNQQSVDETDVITVSKNGQILDSNININVVTAGGKEFNYINVLSESGGVFNTEISVNSLNAILQCGNQLTSCRIFSSDKPKINKTHSFSQNNLFYNSTGLTVGNNNITFAYSSPPITGSPGDICFKTFTELGGIVGWIHDGTNYKPFGQISYRQVASSPIGITIPKMIGEEIFDSNNKNWYKSTGLTNQDWKAIT